MNLRLALTCLVVGLLSACGGSTKKTCKDTGCSAGAVCNETTGQCELLGGADGGTGGGTGGGAGGGTGGGTGGGSGGGTGGGSAGGSGGGTGGTDPLDDGGVFVPGDICGRALHLTFDGTFQGGTLDLDGGVALTVPVDLSTAGDDYVAACRLAGATSGNDLVFELTLTDAKRLVVTATNTDTDSQDPVLALIGAPCHASPTLSCVDATGSLTPEVLDEPRLNPGTYYVLLDNYSANNNATYELRFELADPAPAAPNDTCATAAELTFTNGTTTVTGDTSGATNGTASLTTPALPTCAPAARFHRDVYYRFTLTQPQDVTLSLDAAMGSSYAPALALLTACDGATLNEQLACNSNTPSTITRRGLPAGTYYLLVDGDGGKPGPYELTVTLAPPTMASANDTCAAPVTLTPGTSVTADLTTENGDYMLSCGGSATGGDLVYQFTTTQTQKVTLTAEASAGDPVLELRGAPCASGTAIDCEDTGSAGDTETLVVKALPAGTWYVVLRAYNTATSTFGLTLALDAPQLPPANDTCAAPETVTLTNGMGSATARLTDANRDISSDLCGTGASGSDVVYLITIPAMQTLTVAATPLGQDVDAMLFARTPTCTTVPSTQCIDTGAGGDPETLVVPNATAAAVDVYVVVKAYSSFAQEDVSVSFAVAP